MIYQAKTSEEKRECFEFLQKHGTIPTTDLYFYYKDKEIKTVAGLEICFGDTSKVARIEPFQSDCIMGSIRLFDYLEGFIKGMGCTNIICMSNVEKVCDTLREKRNYKLWSEKLDHYIRNVD